MDTTTTTKMEKLEPSAINPVSGFNYFNFSISLHEYHGNAWISWNTNYPANIRLAVALFNGAVPAKPNNNWITALEVSGRSNGTWDTGHTWGTGYSAALLGLVTAPAPWITIGVNTRVTSD
jgi:hypothetical protein